jgi:hypothetical protein
MRVAMAPKSDIEKKTVQRIAPSCGLIVSLGKDMKAIVRAKPISDNVRLILRLRGFLSGTSIPSKHLSL